MRAWAITGITIRCSPWKRRGARFEEAMAVIGRALTGDRLSFHGEFYHYDDVRLTPQSFQRPRPPIWIGAYGKKAIERAFDYDGWVLWTIPEWGEAGRWIRQIRERAAAAGKGQFTVVMNQDGWIGDDPEAVRARHASGM